ncbi:GntR family transcriptional regulator (plasmid) [Streptomyces sp. BI20]|uniref:GntR family transcriptional regulator n=1 Tax=Streptomyces sp. BI20 TaxID=3403460 RepID=UPI003C790213
MPHDIPRYEEIATDLLLHMAERSGPARGTVPPPETVARHYHVSATTAQFVCRAARTRLRIGNAPARPSEAAPCPAAGLPTHDSLATLVTDDLRRRMVVGELRGFLPSQLTLATAYAVSRPTVRKAVARLTAEGRLAPHRPEGTRIL